MTDVQRQLRFLRRYTIISTTALAILGLAAYAEPGRRRFDEIDVSRINVLEADGTPRLVITNTARSPGLIDKRQPFGDPGRAGTRPGIFFYNDEGTENGGLTVAGRRVNGRVSARAGLSFDRYEQEDVVMLDYEESGATHSQGLRIADRSSQPLKAILAAWSPIQQMAPGSARDSATRAFAAKYGDRAGGAVRLFVGRDTTSEAVLDLKDARGRTRLRLAVDTAGVPSIDFLDERGRVLRRIRSNEP
jgi:hypothetical protein